jgi:hypothetical protein
LLTVKILKTPVIFATDSTCPVKRRESALLMCVHADVTGLDDSVANIRNENAEELKDIVQRCLAASTVADNRTIDEIRSSEVRPAPQNTLETMRDVLLDRGSKAWLLSNFQKKVAMLQVRFPFS